MEIVAAPSKLGEHQAKATLTPLSQRNIHDEKAISHQMCECALRRSTMYHNAAYPVARPRAGSCIPGLRQRRRTTHAASADRDLIIDHPRLQRAGRNAANP